MNELLIDYIYGRLYSSNNAEEIVIIAHGFNGNYQDNENYAEYFVNEGIDAYVFDFHGGCDFSKSGGTMKEMSIITEKNELHKVIDYFENKYERVFLLGESQGGAVAALCAAERNDIAGLILLYPAFCIAEERKKQFQSKEDIPETFVFLDAEVSRRYFADVWDLKIYEEITKYHGPVLIFHGLQDELVSIEDSRKAVKIYDHAELVEVSFAGHGFYGKQAEKPAEKMISFMRMMKEM